MTFRSPIRGKTISLSLLANWMREVETTLRKYRPCETKDIKPNITSNGTLYYGKGGKGGGGVSSRLLFEFYSATDSGTLKMYMEPGRYLLSGVDTSETAITFTAQVHPNDAGGSGADTWYYWQRTTAGVVSVTSATTMPTVAYDYDASANTLLMKIILGYWNQTAKTFTQYHAGLLLVPFGGVWA